MPEYHQVKGDTPSLDFFKNPELAARATLDAQRILGVDAAIMFADLLPIMEPMGLDLDYLPGQGPVFANPIRTQADIEAQVSFSLQLRDAMNVAVSNINAIEVLRKELESIIEEGGSNRTVKEAIRLKAIAEDIASKLYDIHLTGAREDAFRSPIKLYGRLSALASDINSSGIDFKPTNQQGEVYEVLDERLQAAIEQFDELIQNDIQQFNRALQRQDRKIEIEKTGGL